MRWRFADPTNEAEMLYRRQANAQIDSFWSSFEQNLSLPDFWTEEKFIAWVRPELSKISEHLMWEVSFEKSDVRRFVITPESEYCLHPMLETMLERAPQLDNFLFQVYREPTETEYVQDLVVARTQRWTPDVQVAVKATDCNSIDVTFSSAQFKGRNNDNDIAYCFVLSEVLFGQEILEEWIGQIETVSTKRSIFEPIQNLFGAQKTPSQSNQCFSELVEAYSLVAELKLKIVSTLPTVPIWKAEPMFAESTNVAVLKLDERKSERITVTTTKPNIMLGASSRPLCFTSNRFSRCGETFSYLKIDESGSEVNDEVLDRGELEEALDQGLRQASVGCVIGGGWGPVFNFIDLAIEDLDAAIPHLQRLARELELPKSSWLRFMDSKLRNEWVGMYSDSPEPGLSKAW